MKNNYKYFRYIFSYQKDNYTMDNTTVQSITSNDIDEKETTLEEMVKQQISLLQSLLPDQPKNPSHYYMAQSAQSMMRHIVNHYKWSQEKHKK
jgi:hypothetical protein